MIDLYLTMKKIGKDYRTAQNELESMREKRLREDIIAEETNFNYGRNYKFGKGTKEAYYKEEVKPWKNK